MKIPVFLWFELLSFLVALTMIRRLRGSFLFYFIPVLFVIIVIEIAGAYYKIIMHRPTGWLYNFLTILQMPFWMLLFREYVHRPVIKRATVLLLILFLIFSLYNITFIQGFSRFNNYTLIVGAGILIFLCCFYFYELITSGESVRPITEPMFWIATGAILYFTGTFLYFAFYDYLQKIQIKRDTEIFNLINLNLIFVLYICISIGLFLTKFKRV